MRRELDVRELTPLGARGHGESRAERGRRPRATFDAHCDVRHQPPQGHLPRSRDPGLAVPCASLITGRSVSAPPVRVRQNPARATSFARAQSRPAAREAVTRADAAR